MLFLHHMETPEKRVCGCIVKRQSTLNAPKLLKKIQFCQGQQLLLRCVTASFVSETENATPFSMTEQMVQYANRMATDTASLSKMTLSRTSLTYINIYGVASKLVSMLIENNRKTKQMHAL